MSESITAYHGNLVSEYHEQVPAVRFQPQSSGHMRVHTDRTFQAPLRASWWVYTRGDMRPGGTSGGENLDGLHVHFGHLGNDMNYNVHLVRRDGNAKIALEHGLNGYETVSWHTDGGLRLRMWRRYYFELDWLRDSFKLTVHNDNHIGAGKEKAIIQSELPDHGPKFGQLAWRTDNIVTRFGGLSIQKL